MNSLGFSIFYLFLGFLFPLLFLFAHHGYLYFLAKKENKLFSFKNVFPYEIVSGRGKKETLILNLLSFGYILSVGVFPLILLYYELSLSFSYVVYCVFSLAINLLGAFSYILSFHIPLAKNPRGHSASFILGILGMSLGSASFGIILFSYGQRQVVPFEMGVGLGLFLIIVSLLFIVPLLFPQLKDWNRMDQVIEKDGTYAYQRPRFIYLAFLEWLYPFAFLVLSLFSFIAFALI